MIILYGIKTCTTVKKAMAWLASNHIECQLHDVRVAGLPKNFLAQAEAKFGWQALVNKRSTTWRELNDEVKNNLNRDLALETLEKSPTLLKRPIILQDNLALIGFDENEYKQAFL